jgi:plasmid maintenance system antidote protein VapI
MEEKDAKIEVLNRFIEIREQSGLSWNAFCASIDMKQSTIFNQVNNFKALSLETVLKTLAIYSDVSAEWLLRGSGDMFLTKPDGEEDEPKTDSRLDALVDTIALLNETIKTKNATIDALQAELLQYKRKAKKA